MIILRKFSIFLHLPFKMEQAVSKTDEVPRPALVSNQDPIIFYEMQFRCVSQSHKCLILYISSSPFDIPVTALELYTALLLIYKIHKLLIYMCAYVCVKNLPV